MEQKSLANLTTGAMLLLKGKHEIYIDADTKVFLY